MDFDDGGSDSQEGRDDFQSLTTDLEPFTCDHPLLKFGQVGYNGPAGFMWDFAYVYDNLHALGEKKQKYKMLKELQEQCCEGQHLSREDLHVKKERRRGCLAVDAVSTLLVLHFLLDLLNKTRTDAKALTMRNYFKDVGMLVTQEASRHNDVLKFSVGDFPMHVLPTGKLQGFRLWLGRHVHKQVVQLWLTLWKWMAREDNGPLLTEDISSNDDEEPSLVDLLMFCVNFIHSYKAAHSFRQPPPFSTDSMRNLQQCVLKFVAWVVNNVVLEMMTQQDDSQPVPSRRVRRNSDANLRKMSPHEIWRVIEQSKDTGVSYQKICALRKDDPQGGISEQLTWVWYRQSKFQCTEHRPSSRLSFFNVKNFAIVTDASTHSNKDYLMSLAYDPVNGVGAHMCSVHVRSTKVLHPQEMELTPEAERLAARREIERLSSLKFLQGLSAQICKLTDLCLDDFKFPEVLLKMLELQPGDNFFFDDNVAVLNGEEFQLSQLRQLSDLPCLHCIMDQGKVGCAAAAFVTSQAGLQIHFTFDKIHRLLRDLKNPIKAAGLESCVLATTYLFSVNTKPFGSGQWFTEKTQILEAFFESNSFDCQWFQALKERIANDFGMEGCSDREIWDSIPEQLESWRLKGGLAKASRWFSWNEGAAVHLKEWHSSLMLLSWYFPTDLDTDGQSGLLGLKGCLTQMYWEDAHIIFRVQYGMWSWYSQQIHDVKSPEHAIIESLEMVESWMSHQSLQTLAESWSAQTWADVERFVPDQEAFIARVNTYALGCLMNRCATLSKFSAPPETWVGLLDPQQAQVTRMRLLKEYRWFQSLRCSMAPFAAELASDIETVFDLPCRHLCHLCHFDFGAAQELAKLLIGGFADSKVVEDIHQACRVATNPGSNKKLSGATLQLVCQFSEVLDKRGIVHPAAVTREEFLDKWPDARDDFNCRQEFKSSSHSLPARYSEILTKKMWRTVSEDWLRTSYGAWQWMIQYCGQRLADQGVRLEDGLLNRLAFQGQVIEVNFVYLLILGNLKWQALAWPLKLVDASFWLRIKEKSRKDILLKLALHFGDDFAELVLECDSKTTKKSSSDPDQAALVKAVFDHLDADEQKEFRSVKENVYREEKTQKQLKWRKLLNEKMEEQAEASDAVKMEDEEDLEEEVKQTKLNVLKQQLNLLRKQLLLLNLPKKQLLLLKLLKELLLLKLLKELLLLNLLKQQLLLLNLLKQQLLLLNLHPRLNRLSQLGQRLCLAEMSGLECTQHLPSSEALREVPDEVFEGLKDEMSPSAASEDDDQEKWLDDKLQQISSLDFYDFLACSKFNRRVDWPEGLHHVKSTCQDFLDFDQENGGRASKVWPSFLCEAYPFLRGATSCLEMMVLVAERFLFNLVNFNELDQLEFVEFCAGRAHLSREMLRQGFHQGASVDILFHPHHDMLSSKGLRTWFDMVVASRRKSLHWFATRCSSFVPLCISQSMRYEENSFYGDRSRPWVEQGNLQQEVTAMMMFFSFLLDCIPVLEQPTGSVLPKLPSLRNVLWFFDFKKTVTYMGSFAGPTSKPLQIWHPSSGPGSLFAAIARPRPDGLDNLASSGQSWDGSHTYTGNKEMLIESEHYTPEFGACVAQIYEQIRAS
ncbi:unnamed protein product [Cladocopium goreaui]|uniref:Uncharacterized protein n=1 Tax=Cladocopium goreaui TaxID=2562237 RepID=A0A9P1C0T5_9DINO|nr:unnamed protein product [Cladocopium goreaui]